jgi:hypothetical protein
MRSFMLVVCPRTRRSRIGRALAVGAMAAGLASASPAAAEKGASRDPALRQETALSAEEDLAPEAAVSGGFAVAETYVGPYDHVAAGTGLRNAGYGTIRLRGTPDGARKKQAFLYLSLICETSPCPAKRTASFNGGSVTLALLGSDVQPCWTGALIGVYRADVTARIPAAIDGDYKLTQVPSGAKSGSHPWATPATLPLAEGATLVVVFSTTTLTPGAVYVHHGAHTINGSGGSATYTLPLAPAPTGTSRRYTVFGADGQLGGLDSSPFTSYEETWIGSLGSLTQIAGPGTKKNDSDWNGSDGWLWDTHTHLANGLIPAGAPSYDVRITTSADCVVPMGHVLTAR